MWVSLADKKVAEHYKRGLLPEENRQVIILFLEKLSEKPYAEKLSAVTSVGQLYLTAALSWEDRTKNDRISINQKEDAGKILIVMAYYPDYSRKPSAERRCSLQEAVEYIDVFVIRLIEEKYGKL